MVRRVAVVQARTEAFIETISAAQLTTPITIDVEGRKFPTTLETLLIETAVEDMHHRGEINGMLWSDDLEPPYVSYGQWVAEGRLKDGGQDP